jgi:hypothetical protein
MRRGVPARSPAVLGAVLLAGLSGCVTRQAAPPAQHLVPSPEVGLPYDVRDSESQLIVVVYRAGPLASLGHNHIISCHCIYGTVFSPVDPMHTSFDLHFSVDQLTVDDPWLRADENSPDFPPDVPQSARDGTRHNMLGAAVLNAAKYPDVELRSAGLRPAPGGKPGDVMAQVLIRLGGGWHPVTVPMHYVDGGEEITVSGEFPLKQTDLGLTPFSALGGGLSVRDEMNIRLKLIARPRRYY